MQDDTLDSLKARFESTGWSWPYYARRLEALVARLEDEQRTPEE